MMLPRVLDAGPARHTPERRHAPARSSSRPLPRGRPGRPWTFWTSARGPARDCRAGAVRPRSCVPRLALQERVPGCTRIDPSASTQQAKHRRGVRLFTGRPCLLRPGPGTRHRRRRQLASWQSARSPDGSAGLPKPRPDSGGLVRDSGPQAGHSSALPVQRVAV